MTQEDEIAQAVHLCVGPQDFHRLADISLGERIAAIGEHLLEYRRHLRKIAGIFRVDPPAHRLGTVGETEQ